MKLLYEFIWLPNSETRVHGTNEALMEDEYNFNNVGLQVRK